MEDKLTVDQAAQNIDGILQVIRNPALTRQEHDTLRTSLQLLYSTAKDAAEAAEDTQKIIPIRAPESAQ